MDAVQTLMLVLLLCSAYAVLSLRQFERGIAVVKAELDANRRRYDRHDW